MPPVNFPPNKPPTATAKPIWRGNEPCRSFLLESTHENIVSTRIKVIISSTPIA